MSALNDLLFILRQHPAFPDLLRAVATPQLPRFKPSQKMTLEQIGASTAYASGQLHQHENWLAMLTGGHVPPQGESQPSEQEKS